MMFTSQTRHVCGLLYRHDVPIVRPTDKTHMQSASETSHVVSVGQITNMSCMWSASQTRLTANEVIASAADIILKQSLKIDAQLHSLMFK